MEKVQKVETVQQEKSELLSSVNLFGDFMSGFADVYRRNGKSQDINSAEPAINEESGYSVNNPAYKK